MTWQAHVTGHAPPPPPTGRDEGEDTIFGLFENKRILSKLPILCVFILKQV